MKNFFRLKWVNEIKKNENPLYFKSFTVFYLISFKFKFDFWKEIFTSLIQIKQKYLNIDYPIIYVSLALIWLTIELNKKKALDLRFILDFFSVFFIFVIWNNH